jgi:hypothetical protein
MSAVEKIKGIRNGADTAVVMAEKLTARTTLYEKGSDAGYSVLIGHPSLDDFVVGLFREVEDAESLAAELNKAFQPIIEHYCRKFLRSLCQEVHDILDALEQG